MRILVLGAAGFVGTALCRRFHQEGHHVVALSRSAQRVVRLPNCRPLQATLDDRQALDAVLADVDWVFHLAWDTTPGTSAAQPSLEVSHNLLPSMHLLEAMQAHPGLPLAFMSSGGALFDASACEPLHEQLPIRPRSYYGAGKAAMEVFLGAFAQRNRSPVVLLRASNLYGPGQRQKRLFGIIPTLFDCVRRNRPFEIWGDGETVRDFLYIDDFATCCTKLLQWSAPESTTSALNLGSGQGLTINDLCDRIEEVTGRRLERHYRPERGIDAAFVTMDSRRAYQWLNWEASTHIDEGLRRTWEWIQDLD